MAAGKVISLGILLEMIDKVSGPAAKINRNFKSTKSSAEECGRAMAKLGVGITAVGAAMSFMSIKTVSSTFDSQKALGELASLGIKDLDAIEKKATDVSNKWARITKPQFITAAYDIKSAISNLSDSAVADFTEWAAITAKATKGSVEQMGDLFATSYGIYKELYPNMSDSQFAQILAGGIASTVREFKMTGPKMADYVTNLGAQATKMQVPLGEQFAIGGMLGQTMQGSEAATLYQAFLKNPAKAAKKLGIGFTDAAGQLLPMADILDRLKGKFGAVMTVAEKGKLTEAFGRVEAVKLIQLLIGKTDELRQKTQLLKDIINQGGQAAIDMANAINNPPGEKWQLFKQQMGNFIEIMGNALLPKATAIIEKLSSVALSAQRFAETNPGLVKLGMTLFTILDIVLTLSGGLLTMGGAALIAMHSFAGLKLTLEGIRFLMFSMRYAAVVGSTAIWSFFATATKAAWAFLMTNPIGWIILGISAIIMFALAWKNNWLGIGTFMNKVVAGIAYGFTWLWNQIMIGVNWIVSLPGKLYDAGKNMVLSIWEGIKSVAEWPVNKIKEIAQRIRNFLPFSPAKEGPLMTIDKAGVGIVNQLRAGLEKAKPQLRESVRDLFKSAQYAAQDITSVPFLFNWKGFNITSGQTAIMPLPPPGVNGVANTANNLGALGEGDFGAGGMGGTGTIGTGNVYITVHFERDSFNLRTDKVDKQELLKLLGKTLTQELVPAGG